MAVDDHGLEVLKKAGKEITPGDPSDYKIQVDVVSTVGSSSATIQATVDDVATVTVSEDASGDVRMTPQRALHSNLRNNAGTEVATASNPLRVDPTGSTAQPVTDNGGSITVDGTVTANAGTNLNTSALALEAGGNLAAAVTALQIIDDWDESDRAKVNPIVGQAGIQGGSGTVSANTQRVVLATDVALPAGTNIIGALSANQSVNVAQMNGVAVTMGNGASGTGVQRVTIANDSTGIIIATGNVAHDAADSGNPLLIGGRAISATAPPTAVAANDRVRAYFDLQGFLHGKDHAQESASQTLTALNTTYTSTATVESADITTTGYRYCDIFFTIVSAGSPGLMTLKAVGRISSTNFDLDNDWPASWYYSDASVTTTRNIWLSNIPVPKCGTMRFTVQCAGVDGAGNNYVISNCQVFLGT